MFLLSNSATAVEAELTGLDYRAVCFLASSFSHLSLLSWASGQRLGFTTPVSQPHACAVSLFLLPLSCGLSVKTSVDTFHGGVNTVLHLQFE